MKINALVPAGVRYRVFRDGGLDVLEFTLKRVTIRVEYNGYLCTLIWRGRVFGTATVDEVREWIRRCVEQIR